MNDAETSLAKTPAAPVQNPAASRRLAIYYALLVTQTVSLIGSQISQYSVSIAVFRATGHATPLALVAFFSAAPAIRIGGLGGALADRVFEPARRQPVWQSVAWLVGVRPGAGMGMMFVVSDALVLAFSLAVYAIPAVRRLEADLPDHAAAPG